MHTQIEEEIFYPAFLEATGDKDMHHEAEVRAQRREAADCADRSVESGGRLLRRQGHCAREMIKHHVKEEEQRGGMFAEARQSGMDLNALGEQLKSRKDELMAQGMPSRGRGVGRRIARGMPMHA